MNQLGNLVRRRALRGQRLAPVPAHAPKWGMRCAGISVECRYGKRFTAVARFLLEYPRPRNGCALPDDIPDKEDSP
ncbi:MULTISPECIES: hypothetical protein [unclassified Burkholderia]|uniref:hypothetical protein n=1 Tax=unclassified Burkholderia TaxID=2613784 RepID=UPI000F564EA8|nr:MULTISPECIES: hypothetical protein [unclassified Burkholderia]